MKKEIRGIFLVLFILVSISFVFAETVSKEKTINVGETLTVSLNGNDHEVTLYGIVNGTGNYANVSLDDENFILNELETKTVGSVNIKSKVIFYSGVSSGYVIFQLSEDIREVEDEATVNVGETLIFNVEDDKYTVKLNFIDETGTYASITVDGEEFPINDKENVSFNDIYLFANTIFRTGDNSGYIILEIDKAQSNNNETEDDEDNETDDDCDWECTKWSDCIDNVQTRECINVNSCSNASMPKLTKTCKGNNQDDEEENEDDDSRGNGIGQELKEQIQERKQEYQTGNFTGPQGQFLSVNEMVRGLKQIRAGNHTAETDLEVTVEEDNETGHARVKVKLSNGKNAEVKIMPDEASERALERLRLNVCSEENNCSIELKEVGEGNQTRAAYEIQIERHSRILGIFSKKMKVNTEIDAETGDVINVDKPWWAFIASEPSEE